MSNEDDHRHSTAASGPGLAVPVGPNPPSFSSAAAAHGHGGVFRGPPPPFAPPPKNRSVAAAATTMFLGTPQNLSLVAAHHASTGHVTAARAPLGRPEAIFSEEHHASVVARRGGSAPTINAEAAALATTAVSSKSETQSSSPREAATAGEGKGFDEKYERYQDASRIPDPPLPPRGQRITRGGVLEPFPEKLHRILEDADADGKSDVIGFFPHGRSFCIFEPERFSAEIMPRYFGTAKPSSFHRQLNLYDFKRIIDGPDQGGYYHELFLRGRPALSRGMRRVTLKGKEDKQQKKISRKKGNNEDTVGGLHKKCPNFYSMLPIMTSKEAVVAQEANRTQANKTLTSLSGGVRAHRSSSCHDENNAPALDPSYDVPVSLGSNASSENHRRGPHHRPSSSRPSLDGVSTADLTVALIERLVGRDDEESRALRAAVVAALGEPRPPHGTPCAPPNCIPAYPAPVSHPAGPPLDRPPHALPLGMVPLPIRPDGPGIGAPVLLPPGSGDSRLPPHGLVCAPPHRNLHYQRDVIWQRK